VVLVQSFSTRSFEVLTKKVRWKPLIGISTIGATPKLF
jgi:hypothetical protein